MKRLIKYLVTLLIGGAGVLLILFYKDLFSATEPVLIYHILCDAFFVVGVVMTGFGLLVFCSNEGTFDGVTYAVSSFINMFKKNPKKQYDSYYDYKESKGERKVSFGYIVICGLIFLAVSGIMYYLYSQAKPL